MPTYTRSLLRLFSLANPQYANAEVTFYTVGSDNAKTTTLATLYEGLTGSGQLANPQTLDAYGKTVAPIYHSVPVIAVINEAEFGSQETGIYNPVLDVDAIAEAAADAVAAVAGEAPYFVPTEEGADPSDVDNGFYLSAANILGIAADGKLALAITNPFDAVNYTKISGAATGNNVSIQALGSDAYVGIDYKSKGTTTVAGGHFNGNAVETTGRHKFFIEGVSTVEITDTYWNPDVVYDGQPEGKIILSSGADTSAATTDMIAGVISVESDSYGELGRNGLTVDGLTLMLGAKGTTGAIHFLNNGLVGHVSIAAPANAAGADQYAACNILWLKGSQQGASSHPTIFTNGETNVGLQFYTGSGTGKTTFLGHNTATSLLELRPVSTSAIHGFYMNASATGAAPLLGVGTFNGYTSADTNVGLSLSSRGTGNIGLYSHDGSHLQFRSEGILNAVNYLSVKGAVTGNGPTMQAAGSDTNVSLSVSSKGTGLIYFYTGAGSYLQASIQATDNAVNYLNIFGNTTGNNVGISAQGSDTNVGLILSSKGTGGVSLYTGNFGRLGFQVANVASSVNWIIANPSATGVGVALTAGGSDTNIGFGVSSKGSGDVDFYTNNAGTRQFKITHTASAVNYLSMTGAATGNGVPLQAAGSDADISLYLGAKGAGGFNFYTNSTVLQLQIAHTASAVNYIILSGNATSNAPALYMGGSDTNISMRFSAKGTGSLLFYTGTLGREQFRITDTASAVNYVAVTGSATGSPVTLSAAGSDTNIDLSLAPKGTGMVRFGGSSFSANGSVATALSSVGPSGASTTVQEWLTVKNGSTTRYIPCF